MVQVVESSARGAHGPSARVIEVCLRFGVPTSGPSLPGGPPVGLGLCLDPGKLVLISGPSGSGKSRLLEEIGRANPSARMVQDVLFPLDVPVVDAILPTRPVADALALMTACGLSEPVLWLRRFQELSDGERFRTRLARAIGLQQRDSASAVLLCDEFGSVLHRRLAKVIAFNLHKLVKRGRFAIVVATSQQDLERDLAPDQIVRLPLLAAHSGRAESRVPERCGAPRPSFAEQLRIERASLRDYAAFAAMHYRQREQLGFVDRVFAIREADSCEPLGVIVYGHPVLELSLRNRLTGGRWIQNSGKLNRELRVIKRLVIHPDLRGCGLGHWLVRETLPLAGVPFVECLAAMGAVHPVFDKAGMRRVGLCRAPASRDATLKALRSAGADPFGSDFVSQICRRPSVRRLVAAAVSTWYRATTGGGEARVQRQTSSTLARTFRQLVGSEPVYFIWARDDEGRQWIDRGLEALGDGDHS